MGDMVYANYFRGHKETVISKVQGKLLQYYEKMKEEQQQIRQDKQQEFLNLMVAQIDKLDFLMQSLIKMSRLETGIFVLHPEKPGTETYKT